MTHNQPSQFPMNLILGNYFGMTKHAKASAGTRCFPLVPDG